MNSAAIDRILHRHVLQRGGTSTAAGELSWDVAFPADDEDEDAATLSFQNNFTLEDGRVTSIGCDAPLDQYTMDQAMAVASFQTDLAAALAREGMTFASFDALAEHLVAEADGEVDDGAVRIPPADEDGEPVFVSIVPVTGEPWVSLATPFVDGVDPGWLLEQNGELTHVHFEAFEGSVSLACAFPLAQVTGQRVLELVDDLFSFRERLLEELESGDEEEEEEGPA
jgi:hypothetical protein